MAREGVSSESDYITGGVAVTGNISTLALWVVKDDSTLDVIFEQVNNASTSDDQRMWVDTSDQLVVSSEGQASTSSATLTGGQWHHLAGVFNGNSSRTGYLDGVASTENTNFAAVGTTQNEMNIGRTNRNGANTLHWDGRYAEAAIWSVALTAAEVASLAKGAWPPLIRPASIVFYSGLKNGVFDETGQITLTDNGTVDAADHPPISYPRTIPMFAPAAGAPPAARRVIMVT